jgi:hypothetical protein
MKGQTMKKSILLSLAAVASLAAAAPALAQPFDGHGWRDATVQERDMRGFDGRDVIRTSYDHEINRRTEFLGHRIDEDVRRGQMSFWRGRHLRDQLTQIRWMEQRYRAQNNGYLTGWQSQSLNARVDAVAAQMNFGRR